MTRCEAKPNEAFSSLQQMRDFARALDQDDFATATKFLSPSCKYHSGQNLIIGAEAIMNSYRENSCWAKANLDAVEYESLVEHEADRVFLVSYTDRVRFREKVHTYRCRQRLMVGSNGEIVEIEHIDLPHEGERLKAFFDECGIERGTS